MQLKALLLDLDGTLVDTAPDMVATLNRLLISNNCSAIDETEASKLVSNGARALIDFGFSESRTETKTLKLIDDFLSDYELHISEQSKVYEGMKEVIEYCELHKIRWGVVTNKPFGLSRKLLDDLGLLERSSILLGGDSLAVKKPDPAPLLHCCMVMNLAASECLYVGDHERDIIAGKAAGMDTAAALWGYIQPQHKPDEWGANFLLNQPNGLLTLLKEKNT